jgi:hypothetical protein
VLQQRAPHSDREPCKDQTALIDAFPLTVAPAVGSAIVDARPVCLTPPEIAHFLSKLRARIGFKRLPGAQVGLSTSELQQLRGCQPGFVATGRFARLRRTTG